MELTLNTPALLFPAITLLMLAYTNRFLGLSSRIRSLHDRYLKETTPSILPQIRNIRTRLHMIRYMQFMGSLSFLLCIACMFFIYLSHYKTANWVFASSLGTLFISIFLSLIEIQISTKALELELGDMEELSKDSNLLDHIRSYFDKQQS